MVTKDLTNLLGLCHKVLSGGTRLKINREWEGAWLKNSSVGRGFPGTAWEGRESGDGDAWSEESSLAGEAGGSF